MSSISTHSPQKNKFPLHPYSLIERSHKGVSWKTFGAFRKKSQLSDAEWAMILDMTPRTLQRYIHEEKTFGSSASEKILLAMQVVEKGTEVFGDKSKFILWLRSPIIALGGKEPREFFDTISGLLLLQDELGRIEYGVFA